MDKSYQIQSLKTTCSKPRHAQEPSLGLLAVTDCSSPQGDGYQQGPLLTGPRMLLPAPRFFTSHTQYVGIQTAHPPSCWGLLEGRDLSGGSDGKEAACSAGDPGSIPETERSPGEGNDHPFQNSCLENPTDRGAWRATVHGVAKRQTRQSDSLTHTHTHPGSQSVKHDRVTLSLSHSHTHTHTHTPWRAASTLLCFSGPSD